MATQNGGQNLYQIPNCTICLNQLYQDLSTLGCGHVFHLNCISQHFQYRGTCPNCQRRSHAKDIRMVMFPLTKNTQSASLMRQLLGNLSSQQKQQIQTLFKQLQSTTQKNQKLERQLGQAQKQAKVATKQLNQNKVSYNKIKIDIEQHRKEGLEYKKVIQYLQNEIKNLNNQNLQLRTVIEQYKQKQSQYQKLKRLKKIMTQNSQAIIAYKNQLQTANTPAEQMSKRFFDMILIKHLQVTKLKGINENHPRVLYEKNQEILQLKTEIERLKRDKKDVQEKKSAENKKCEELKIKYEDFKIRYRNLLDKYRAKCQGGMSDQEQEDSMSRLSFPLANTVNVRLNSNNSNFSNSIKVENISSNLSFTQNKSDKKKSSNISNSMIIEQQLSNSVSRNNQAQKKSVQISLNSFVSQKSSFGSFGSYGGVIPKKKAQDAKAPMKNLFI